MQHIIKKQIIDLSVDKKQDAFHVQQEVSNYYRNKILPLLEKAFDAASNEDETISVDSLEIDLGVINIKETEKAEEVEKVFLKIEEMLIPIKQEISSKVNAKKKSRELSVSEQWIFYMRHGYLPWNVLQINKDWHDKVLQAFASNSAAISALRDLIRNHFDSVKRIIYQHSENFLKSLVETLTAENQNELPKLINELSQFSSSDKKKKQLNSLEKKNLWQKLWEDALMRSASEEINLKSSIIVRLLLLNTFSEEQLKAKKFKDFLSKNKIEVSEEIKNTKPQKHFEKDRKIEMDEEEIYIENAGVVLLHPFLIQFFKMLDLLKEDGFKDSFHQQKSLYLLHFLASGNAHPLEHELTIAKVLCEFPPEEPVTNLIKLNDPEITESDELLKEVIRQWSILKNTSVDGLREGFLQRKGKLFIKNNVKHLQIEQSSIDMLLDHLPWNLSIIKLPWMRDILKVEWR